jgi:hypothetical protein
MYQRERRAQVKIPGNFVYIVRWLNDRSRVKIGYTSNLVLRLSEMRTNNFCRLELLAAIPVEGRKDEATIHRFFEEFHCCREWFHAAPSLLETSAICSCQFSQDEVAKLRKALGEDVILGYALVEGQCGWNEEEIGKCNGKELLSHAA